MVDVTKNTGTVIGMSATLPATYDSEGYAVPVITDIGEVVDVGEIAKTWAAILHQSVTREYPQKIKDTYDIPDVTLTIGRVSSDAGQVLLQTALASAAHYTFEIVLPSADTAYFTALVTKSGIGAIASGAITTTTVTLAIDPESLYEG